MQVHTIQVYFIQMRFSKGEKRYDRQKVIANKSSRNSQNATWQASLHTLGKWHTVLGDIRFLKVKLN